jgi:hypothetical protein
MTRRCWPLFVFASCVVAPTAALAHHSYTEYDDTRTVEIEGKLVDVQWQNPHARIRVEVASAAGLVTWDIESSPLNYLRRMQVPLEVYRLGSTVKVAGWPSKRSDVRMYGTNLLSSDRQETVLFRSQPRWRDTAHAYGSTETATADTSANVPDTMFHVWVSAANDTDRNNGTNRNRWVSVSKGSDGKETEAPLSLTEAAKQVAATFNPTEETTAVGCKPKGMPYLMSNPAPIEFIDREDVILLRLEEYDTVRTIHMSANGGEDAPKTLLGYSTGRWEGNTLVVDTSRISSPYLNNRGVPLGSEARLVERFTLSADRNRLDYELTVTDPEMLIGLARLKRSWVWRPHEQVLPFNCTEQPAADK